MSQAQIEERADKMVRHLAVEVDATNEQQDKLRGIMRAAVKDVVPAAERARNARLQGRELLAATAINRGDLEKLRAEQIASADAVSEARRPGHRRCRRGADPRAAQKAQ